MLTTHIWSMNGRSQTELRDPDLGPEGLISHLLARLEGKERHSLVLWKLPEGKGLMDVTPDDDRRRAYIQCAGDYNARMAAEIRELVDGVPHQYALGRTDGAESDAEPDQIVSWNDHELKMRANEVLTGPEVDELFLSYYRNGREPPEYSRRKLRL